MKTATALTVLGAIAGAVTTAASFYAARRIAATKKYSWREVIGVALPAAGGIGATYFLLSRVGKKHEEMANRSFGRTWFYDPLDPSPMAQWPEKRAYPPGIHKGAHTLGQIASLHQTAGREGEGIHNDRNRDTGRISAQDSEGLRPGRWKSLPSS